MHKPKRRVRCADAEIACNAERGFVASWRVSKQRGPTALRSTQYALCRSTSVEYSCVAYRISTRNVSEGPQRKPPSLTLRVEIGRVSMERGAGSSAHSAIRRPPTGVECAGNVGSAVRTRKSRGTQDGVSLSPSVAEIRMPDCFEDDAIRVRTADPTRWSTAVEASRLG